MIIHIVFYRERGHVYKLADADAIVFGTPAKFGMMAAQMRNLLDQTRPFWADGASIGKVGSVFTSTIIRGR